MKTLLIHLFVAFALIQVSCIAANAEPSISPTLYVAKVTLVVRAPTGADPVIFVREHLPTYPEDDPAITVEQVGKAQPPMIELGFKDRDPQVAAKRANEIANAVCASVKQKPTELPIIGVTGFAESPKRPSLTKSLLAEESPLPRAASAEQLRWEWREFPVSDIHDLRFGAYEGFISFTIGNESYTYSPAFRDGALSGPAGDVSACAAVLGELRNAKKLKIHVAIGPNDKGQHGLSNLILLFDPPK